MKLIKEIFLLLIVVSTQSDIHAAALPERIAVQFTNENGK